MCLNNNISNKNNHNYQKHSFDCQCNRFVLNIQLPNRNSRPHFNLIAKSFSYLCSFRLYSHDLSVCMQDLNRGGGGGTLSMHGMVHTKRTQFYFILFFHSIFGLNHRNGEECTVDKQTTKVVPLKNEFLVIDFDGDYWLKAFVLGNHICYYVFSSAVLCILLGSRFPEMVFVHEHLKR